MQSWQKLYDDWQIKAFCAIEIEWYLLQNGLPASNDIRAIYIEQLKIAFANLKLHSVEAETSMGQVEAALNHTDNMAQLVVDATILRDIAHSIASHMQLEACFKAKPFEQAHGSGLHVHVHLEDLAAEQLFWVQEDCQTTYGLSAHLGFALAGLLAHMQRDLAIFAGNDAAMQRYEPNFNAPTNVSWGFNNRTTALRLPDNVGHAIGLEAILQMRNHPQLRRFKRIEHRVSSAEADISATLEAILLAINNGITEQLIPKTPTHGNAHDAGYDLQPFILIMD